MKKYIFLLTLILIVGIFFIPFGEIARAEVSITDEDAVLEPSSWATEFEETWLPKIENGLVVFVSAVLGLLSLAFPIFKMMRLIKDTVERLKEAKGDTEKQAEIIVEQEGKLREITEELKLTKERLDAAIKDNAVLQKQNAEIKEMLKMGFGNMKELVINGYAKQIAEIGETEDEQQD